RERLRGALMLALYRSGRQADALEVYRRGSRLLIDELRLEPGEDLRRLEHEILTHDPAIGGPATTRRAVPVRRRSRIASLALGALALCGVAAGLAVWHTGKSSGSPRSATADQSVA